MLTVLTFSAGGADGADADSAGIQCADGADGGFDIGDFDIGVWSKLTWLTSAYVWC